MVPRGDVVSPAIDPVRFQQSPTRKIPVFQRAACKSVLLAGALLTPSLQSQTAASPDNGKSVFKANARIVVLDVVVSGKGGVPLPGLQKQDFLVTEQGHPQAITYFEEHSSAQPRPVLPALPPNVFSNIPLVQANGPLTILLLDSLNTPLADQAFVRTQTLKYLAHLRPGQRIAIFTLGAQLRLIQNFTDDPALLAAAINAPQNGVATQSSPLLQSSAEKAADQEEIRALAEHSADMAAAMRQFLTDQTANRGHVRVNLTLDALQALAHYLAGLPGRKNLVWFSGAFPAVIFPDSGLRNTFGAQRDDQQQLLQTNAVLAAAQVAVYPVAAEGLATDAIYSAGNDARQGGASSIRPRREDAEERGADHASMDQIARGTGGVAFYNNNGLTDALDRVAQHSANFYTLSYTSTNPNPDGRFRRIQVKLANKGGYELAYRRGYYADSARGAEAAQTAAAKPQVDPLLGFLRPGLPASTEVSLTMRVVRGSTQAAVAAALPLHNALGDQPPQGGDNTHVKGPLTRYNIDLMVPASGLHFETSADGLRHVSIETALIVFDSAGKPVNWMFRQLNLKLDPARYAAAQATGINLYQEIDAPADAVLLRGGICDLKTRLIGTLEVPLKNIHSADHLSN
jgi:VWFA-related protein